MKSMFGKKPGNIEADGSMSHTASEKFFRFRASPFCLCSFHLAFVGVCIVLLLAYTVAWFSAIYQSPVWTASSRTMLPMLEGDGLITFPASVKEIHQMLLFTKENIFKMFKRHFQRYPSHDLFCENIFFQKCLVLNNLTWDFFFFQVFMGLESGSFKEDDVSISFDCPKCWIF